MQSTTTKPSSFSKALFYLSLSISFSLISVISVYAQNNKKAKTDLPSVSQEVYQAIAQFYEYDRNMPLEPRILKKQELPQGNREKITFKGVNQVRVPSYLIFPKEAKEKYPIILIADGIYGSKDRWFEDDSWPKGGLITKSFLEAGFAVMILDAVFHGERAVENEYFGPPWIYTYPHSSNRMIIQTSIEYRRAIDYLSTRPEIDITKLGMMGLSMGGLITFEVAAVDDRIKSAIAGVTPISKKPEFQSVEPTTFASRIQSESFLMFMGSKDGLYKMEDARELFSRIPTKQKEFVEYEVGHQPPMEYIKLVTDWFLKRL